MDVNNVEEEITQSHDQADALISLFFATVDIIVYITILILFGWEFKDMFSHEQKLCFIIMFDAILRLINLYTNSFVYSLSKELITTILSTFQFFLIINSLNQVFTYKNNPNLSQNSGISNQLLCVIIFFCSAIILNFSKIVSLLQYIFAIIALFSFWYYIKNKIQLFLDGIGKRNPAFNSHNFTLKLPYFILIYFFIHYVLKISSLFIQDSLYLSYIQMGYDIFKEVGKYLVFGLMICIYYLFSKYISEDDYYVFPSEANNRNNDETISIKS